jgi:uncharacterized protein
MIVRDTEQFAAQAIEVGNYEEAVRLLEPLVEHNSEYALLSLGWIYETGATGPVDKKTACFYYELAVAAGNADAYFYLGRLFLSNGEDAQAREVFQSGAQLDNIECKSQLAILADKDIEQLAAKAIEERNYAEAACLLQPLVEHNSEYALLSLGWIYETGATGPVDKKTARFYYELAANQGSADAYYELGRLHSSNSEESLARIAFEAGAERSNIPCMSRLGEMMVKGRGGSIDIAMGTEWLVNAAKQGHIFAQRSLLDIEENNAKSLFEKLSVKRKIVSLMKRGATKMWKDPDSDKLR